MLIKELPRNAFVDPKGINKHEVNALLRQAVESLVAKLSMAANRPPCPDFEKVKAFQKSLTMLPEKGATDAKIIEILSQFYDHSTNVAHPYYMAHMSPLPTTFSVIGEVVAAAINNNMISLELSPLFTQMETQLTKDVAKHFGLGEKAGGVILSGGSLSNLQAIAMARNDRFPNLLSHGLQGIDKKMVIIASQEAHTSILRAGMTLGIGSDNVKFIPTDESGRLSLPDLVATLESLKNESITPLCIIATAGTTVAGVIDPLEPIAKIAKEYGVWFHVDAAYGGALIFSHENKHLLKGIEHADSITFNPQKWLFVTKTCSFLMVRDYARMSNLFSVYLPYMQTPDEYMNLGEITVQGSRHAEIVKVWSSFQHFGKEGLGHLVDYGITLKDAFVSAIEARPYLKLAHKPQTNVVCFRYFNPAIDSKKVDELNASLQKFLTQECGIFLSAPWYKDKKWLKAVLLNPYINDEIIKTVFEKIDLFLTSRNLI
jgi:glutamate/tyrosine decarboxylase-like PLP-dependent enzyme